MRYHWDIYLCREFDVDCGEPGPKPSLTLRFEHVKQHDN